ncbi:MAG: ATP-binding protein syrD [Candidatus Magnetoglobus multicellularis str. Araruama]|uniref:ATP-binding protein syrD n=1 Tax=Candidatus Magnetoglobus multicellularis str. Araruama TaxID=890399 RepID=A0A1V1PAD9_9BACT|nr:MAG: ATP-binding protein syrD [Candidatus Magnetoglobus multicellularis str. Araruama]
MGKIFNYSFIVEQENFLKTIKSLFVWAFTNGVTQAAIVVIVFHIAGTPQLTPNVRIFFMFVLFVLLDSVTRFRFNIILIYFIENTIAHLRLQIIDHVRRTDLTTYLRLKTEHIYISLTSDMNELSNICHTLAVLLRTSVSECILTSYLIFLSQEAFVITVIILILFFICFAAFSNHLQGVIQKIREAEIKFLETINDLIEGVKELRLNSHKSDAFFSKSVCLSASQLRKAHHQNNISFIFIYLLFYGTWICGVIMITLTLSLLEKSSIRVIQIIGLFLYIPVTTKIYNVIEFLHVHISIKRFNHLYNSLSQINYEQEQYDSNAHLQKFNHLHYENISFTYQSTDGQPFDIKTFSLIFQPDEITFITGGNGSGKSTLINLILGLYPSDSGHIYLDNQLINIRQQSMLFAPIFQDFHLFDRLYGLQKIDDQKLRDLLSQFHLDKHVQYIDGKFTTLKLSRGQQKRLALVSAIMLNSPIYVFDEWAADQDPYFRRYFYETLLPEFKADGKTVIAVTHDDRWFHVADRVLEMSYGRLSVK